MKRCRICKATKPLTEFHSDCSKPDGLSNRCKVCNIAHAKKYDALIPRSKKLEYERIHHYGITSDQYDGMITDQDGKCAVCGGPPKIHNKLFVDHCHETDLVRGLLCSDCNSGLGYFKDDAAKLAAAIHYLNHNLGITPQKVPRKRRSPLFGKGTSKNVAI
jgi:hypothetical protein